MKPLIIIPARGGSKGIPKKNIKPLNGKPLIYYSIDIARELADEKDICVSTDDDEIIKVVEDYKLHVPFKRPMEFATDNAGTSEVLLHALEHYEALGRKYDAIVLLQPTSPLRKAYQVTEASRLFTLAIDMVVSVKKSHAASVICSENAQGFIALSLSKNGVSRQALSDYYEYNGAIYVINVASLKKFKLAGLTKIIKYVMPNIDSVDIDTPLDWEIAETLANKLTVKE